jgi:heme-degrading monooxygenase HmoA
MVIEYIRYTVPAGDQHAFEHAYQRAGAVLDRDEHCRAYQVSRGVEEPAHYTVRIEWDSVEGHEHGFRSGPNFREFFVAIRAFVENIDEMKHYELLYSSPT